MVGTILADYQPKRICTSLKQPKVHVFFPRKSILVADTQCLCGTHTQRLCGQGTPKRHGNAQANTPR